MEVGKTYPNMMKDLSASGTTICAAQRLDLESERFSYSKSYLELLPLGVPTLPLDNLVRRGAP